MNLLIRTDASVTMGTGHMMRCLALAQAWQDAGGRALFTVAESTSAVRARVAAESCEVLAVSSEAGTAEDASETVAIAKEQGAEWIAVDGYHFTADYQRALKGSGFKLLCFDDYGHAEHYSADVVLNQNVGARESLYPSRDPQTRLLLGPRYCVLRREFSAWRDWKREIPPVGRRLLVTMGGSDPENVAVRIVEALAFVQLEDLEAIIVVGGSSPHTELEKREGHPGMKISVRRDVPNVAELMAWADAAVSSAGTTCWELCLLAVPSLLVDVAQNQTPLARELAHRHCAIHVGGPRDFTATKLAEQIEQLLSSREMRQDLSLRSRQLVDGRGAWRVVSAMRARLRLRPARENDCRLLWEWANDPKVRAAAFSPAPIPWEQHKVWFASKMKDPDCHILVAEDGQGKAVGQFRVDWSSNGDGHIDVSLASECRGVGYGSVLIDLGVTSVFAERGGRVHAFIKVENHASRHAFELAGFTSLGKESVDGQQAVHYVRINKHDQTLRSE
ncbi:MAG TPA: UDP-2,4-diacetamido-2,4,6-trideoxy-beta-L-altropyranose hydrolase [Candidatus Sulfotelmatobacter sp.]|nr:UDP-2,4-diacetamido-2,4,6-trideoxy-beta-L-altropyranose hydrolase [Candidatus Sulfotelmatobacter sp.]